MPKTLRWEPPHTPFTLAHVHPLGVTPRILEHAVATGRVVRLTRGVYVSAAAVPELETDRHVQAALARQVRRPHAIASHETAALAWGLELDDPSRASEGPVRFTEPPSRGGRSRRDAGMRVSVRRLPPEDRAQHPCGLVVTSPARTAVDLAAELDLPEALITLDAAARMFLRESAGSAWLRDQYTRSRRLDAAVEPLHRAATSAVTHLNRARLTSSLLVVDPRRESPAESLSFGHMVVAGLPLPELQVQIADDQGRLFPDFLWRGAMLIGEVDGNVKYRSREDLVAERRREARLRALGYRVERWEAAEVRRRPGRVMARLAALLAAGC